LFIARLDIALVPKAVLEGDPPARRLCTETETQEQNSARAEPGCNSMHQGAMPSTTLHIDISLRLNLLNYVAVCSEAPLPGELSAGCSQRMHYSNVAIPYEFLRWCIGEPRHWPKACWHAQRSAADAPPNQHRQGKNTALAQRAGTRRVATNARAYLAAHTYRAMVMAGSSTARASRLRLRLCHAARDFESAGEGRVKFVRKRD
jgi:hypothetical protein